MTSSVVSLGLVFKSLSSNITPEGVTAHYGGDSPWRSGVGAADHARCPSIVRSWHDYHLSKGWSGLAYSAVVCPHGIIYQGRWIDRRTAANGTNAGNQRSYAVCYLAGDADEVTPEAKRAFHIAAALLRSHLRWRHQDWKSTSCPGQPIMRWSAAGWPLPAGPTTPLPPNPTKPPAKPKEIFVTPDDERKFEAMLDRKLEKQTNGILQFLVAVLNDLFGKQFNKLAEWTALMRTDPKDVELLKKQSAEQTVKLREIAKDLAAKK